MTPDRTHVLSEAPTWLLVRALNADEDYDVDDVFADVDEVHVERMCGTCVEL